MKRAVIVHCWSGDPDYCWYPYAKKALEKRDFEVIVPEFPDTDSPNLGKWLPVLQEAIGTSDKETFLIGHSAGCITILRYLETLAEGERIGGAVLVAGFTDDLGYEELKNFFTMPIDFEKIKQRCPKFVAINSDNDPYVPLKYADILKDKLHAEVIVKHNAGHFSGAADNEDSCLELPEVVTSVLELASVK